MYIEYVLIENFIINFFIISSVCRLLNEKNRFGILGALLGSLVSILYPLFNLTMLMDVLLKVCTGIMITTLCFPCKKVKETLMSLFIFLVFTFAFGGVVEFGKQMLGYMTIMGILLSSLILFVILKIGITYVNRKKILNNFSAKVYIIDKGRKIEERGYFDSGNLLYDPITQKPICLITYQVFSKLYEKDLISLFMSKIDEKGLKNGHYINVNSAVKGGKMLVFSVEKMIIKNGEIEKSYENVCLGLSFSGFDKAMHSAVLLHSSQMGG